MSNAPHLFEFLTHDEFSLAFCVAFTNYADGYVGSYPIDRYETPGREGSTDDWLERIKRSIRFLAFECGVKFKAINPHRDGRIAAEAPVEPRNRLYVLLFLSGGFPPVDIMLPNAVRIAQELAPGLNVEPMRAVAADVEDEIERGTRTMPFRDAQKAAAIMRHARRDWLEEQAKTIH